jgi:hypothetical protein
MFRSYSRTGVSGLCSAPIFCSFAQQSIGRGKISSDLSLFQCQAIDRGKRALQQLAQLTSRYVEMEAYVCDYFESSDGEYYLDLTAVYQGDTSVIIAQHLEALHFAATDDLEACDSSIIRTANLYNFREATKKIFISAEIIDQENVDLANQLIYNQPCKFYKSKQKRHYHRLENFCYNYLQVKGKVRDVKSMRFFTV